MDAELTVELGGADSVTPQEPPPDNIDEEGPVSLVCRFCKTPYSSRLALSRHLGLNHRANLTVEELISIDAELAASP